MNAARASAAGVNLAPWVGMGLTVSLTAAGWIASTAAVRSATDQRLGQHERRLTDVEVEQKSLTQDLVEMKADLKWIRRSLEQPRP